jgi:hypothetical protein
MKLRIHPDVSWLGTGPVGPEQTVVGRAGRYADRCTDRKQQEVSIVAPWAVALAVALARPNLETSQQMASGCWGYLYFCCLQPHRSHSRTAVRVEVEEVSAAHMIGWVVRHPSRRHCRFDLEE